MISFPNLRLDWTIWHTDIGAYKIKRIMRGSKWMLVFREMTVGIFSEELEARRFAETDYKQRIRKLEHG